MEKGAVVAAVFNSTVVAGILIVAGTIILAVSGFFVVAWIDPKIRSKENNDFIAMVHGVVSGLFAILLAVIVVDIWGDFSAAKTQAETEVTRISNLLRNAGGFPASVRVPIREVLLQYTHDVAYREWPAMSHGHYDPTTEAVYAHIWQKYGAYTPTAGDPSDFYIASITALNNLGQARRLRLLYAGSVVPLALWILIIIGAVVTFSFMYVHYAPHRRVQAEAIGVLATLLGFVFFLIYALQHPYSGSLSVTPEAYIQLIEQWPKSSL